MSIKYNTLLPDVEKYVILHIHQYHKKKVAGMIYHSLYPDGKRFRTVLEMVKIIEAISAEIDYPARSVERRSFCRNHQVEYPRSEEKEGFPENSRMLAAFKVRIIQCQRGSWQGSAEEVETGVGFEFESFMELLKHFESCLNIPPEACFVSDLKPGRYIIKLDEEVFLMQLLYTKHATWQGILQWKTQKKTVQFRSYLELIMLISEGYYLSKEEIPNEMEAIIN